MIVDLTDRILRQGKAPVRAIEAIGVIEPTNRLERKLTGLFCTSTSAACAVSWRLGLIGLQRRY